MHCKRDHCIIQWPLYKSIKINNEKNNKLYQKYADLSLKDDKVIFGGRLGQYKYYDMDKVIIEALKCAKKELK